MLRDMNMVGRIMIAIVIFSSIVHPLTSQLSCIATQKGLNFVGTSSFAQFGASVSISDDGRTFAVGSPGASELLVGAGQVRIYTFDRGLWLQKGGNINGFFPHNRFGTSLSLSSDGNTVAIGTLLSENGGSTGDVSIFTFDGSHWNLKGSVIKSTESNDLFSNSIDLSLDGNTVAIGAPWSDIGATSSGSVSLFYFDGNDWTKKGEVLTGSEFNSLGKSVALSSDGNVVVAGATNDNAAVGSVRVYSYESSEWVQKGAKIEGTFSAELFGHSVSISNDGNIFAAGAPRNSEINLNSGEVRVNSYFNSNWIQLGSDISGESFSEWFGHSVSLSGDGKVLAAGSPFFSELRPGSANIFEYNGNDWQKLTATIVGDKNADNLGINLQLSQNGSCLAIGASGYDLPSLIDIGQAKVYSIENCTNTEVIPTISEWGVINLFLLIVITSTLFLKANSTSLHADRILENQESK